MSVNNNAIEWPLNTLTAMMSAHRWGMMSLFLAVLGEEKLYVADIWAFPCDERGSVWPSVCLCVSAGTGTITSVCVCQLCNSALNVIKQVLYNGRFLTCKAFAVCYENVFLTLWWAFVWDVSAVQTVSTAGLHFFGGGRIVNFEPPEDVVKPVM